jgi:hypothetical protein
MHIAHDFCRKTSGSMGDIEIIDMSVVMAMINDYVEYRNRLLVFLMAMVIAANNFDISNYRSFCVKHHIIATKHS